MKRKHSIAAMLFLMTGFLAAQTKVESKLTPRSVGFSLVGTRHDAAQTSGSGMGLGGQISLDFKLTRSLILTAGAGILTATDDIFAMNNRKTIFLPSLDFSVKYNLMRERAFQPFMYGGLGFYNATDKVKLPTGTTTSKHSFASYLLAGAGFEMRFKSSASNFFISGEYRGTISGDISPKPIYWVMKTGLRLSLDKPAVLAEEDRNSTEYSNLFAAEESSGNKGLVVEQVDNLENKVSDNANKIIEMQAMINDHDNRFAAMNKGGNSVASGTPLKKAELNVPYKTLYRQGLEIYRQADYQAAKQIFLQLEAADPNHELASNCKYWLGECYHALGENQKAIAEFDQVLNFSASYKLDDSLLMKGQCYLLLDEKEKAFSIFRELLRRFPGSEYTKRARNYLNAG